MVSSGKGSDLFERYEELILRKSALQKECFQLEQEYLRIFGKDIMALYHMQLESSSYSRFYVTVRSDDFYTSDGKGGSS